MACRGRWFKKTSVGRLSNPAVLLSSLRNGKEIEVTTHNRTRRYAIAGPCPVSLPIDICSGISLHPSSVLQDDSRRMTWTEYRICGELQSRRTPISTARNRTPWRKRCTKAERKTRKNKSKGRKRQGHPVHLTAIFQGKESCSLMIHVKSILHLYCGLSLDINIVSYLSSHADLMPKTLLVF